MRPSRLAALAFTLLLAFPGWAERFTFESDSSYYDKGKSRMVLVGKARLVSDDTKISADRIELFGKDNRYALCSGNVAYVDTKKGVSINTEKLEYDRVAKRSTMQGPTVMEDKENKVVIKGSFIVDDGETEITLIQINVRIIKEGMICRSEYAYYRRKDKLLELSGLPVVVKDGNEYRASRITVDLDKDDVSMDGGVTGSLKDDKPSPSPAPASPASSESPAPETSSPSPETASPSPGPSPAGTGI